MTPSQELAIRHELSQGRPPHLVARHYVGVTVAEVERLARVPASYYERERQRLLAECPAGRTWEEHVVIVVGNF